MFRIDFADSYNLANSKVSLNTVIEHCFKLDKLQKYFLVIS